MSLSVSEVLSDRQALNADSSSSSAYSAPVPTLAEHLQRLARTGLSTDQIATTVGLTVTQVRDSLDEDGSVGA